MAAKPDAEAKTEHVEANKKEPWLEITSVPQILELLRKEQVRIKKGIPNQPSKSVVEMKANMKSLPPVIKHCITRTHLLVTRQHSGIEEICPELAKYVITLTNSAAIIHSNLCHSVKQNLIQYCINLFDHIFILFTKVGNHDLSNLESLVGIIWEDLKDLSDTALENKLGISKNIATQLALIRDAKRELSEAIAEFESESQITKIDNPLSFKLSLDTKNDSNKETDTETNNVTKAVPSAVMESILGTNDDDGDDDDILDYFLSDNIEFSEIESIRLYQTQTLLKFIDSTVSHIYTFILRNFNDNHSKHLGDYLEQLYESIAELSPIVDDLCAAMYPPQESQQNIIEYFQQSIRIVLKCVANAEKNEQFTNRTMRVFSKQKKKSNKKAKNPKIISADKWKSNFNTQCGSFMESFGMTICNNDGQEEVKTDDIPSTPTIDID